MPCPSLIVHRRVYLGPQMLQKKPVLPQYRPRLRLTRWCRCLPCVNPTQCVRMCEYIATLSAYTMLASKEGSWALCRTPAHSSSTQSSTFCCYACQRERFSCGICGTQLELLPPPKKHRPPPPRVGQALSTSLVRMKRNSCKLKCANCNIRSPQQRRFWSKFPQCAPFVKRRGLGGFQRQTEEQLLRETLARTGI